MAWLFQLFQGARPATPRAAKQSKRPATSPRNIEPLSRLQTSPGAARSMEISDASSGSGGRGPQALVVSRHAHDGDGRQRLSESRQQLHLPAAGRTRARNILSARADQYRSWLAIAEPGRLDDPRL